MGTDINYKQLGLQNASSGITDEIGFVGHYEITNQGIIDLGKDLWKEGTQYSFYPLETESEQFIKAVELAKIIFQETLYNIIGKVKARKIVLEKLKNTTKDYLELEEYVPYEETILKNEEGNHILFALYPSNRGGWGIKTIKKSLEDKTDRLQFPKEWAGLEKEELEQVSGIKGMEFCHTGRFLVTCKTKEAAYQVLDKVLPKGRK